MPRCKSPNALDLCLVNDDSLKCRCIYAKILLPDFSKIKSNLINLKMFANVLILFKLKSYLTNDKVGRISLDKLCIFYSSSCVFDFLELESNANL
jgi:hypothetical protein